MDQKHKCISCHREVLYRDIPICFRGVECDSLWTDKYYCNNCNLNYGIVYSDYKDQWICYRCIKYTVKYKSYDNQWEKDTFPKIVTYMDSTSESYDSSNEYDSTTDTL
jgi:hypothetical protein